MVMLISLWLLTKIIYKVKPKFQALLIDTLIYKPAFLLRASKEAPKILGMDDGEELQWNLVEDITKVNKTL